MLKIGDKRIPVDDLPYVVDEPQSKQYAKMVWVIVILLLLGLMIPKNDFNPNLKFN